MQIAAEISPPWRTLLRVVAVTIYSVSMFVVPPSSWPEELRSVWMAPRQWCLDAVEAAYLAAGVAPVTAELRIGTYFVLLAGVVPWALLAIVGRGKPFDLGWRRPNRIGWRVIIVGTTISIPFLLWMVRTPGFARAYLAWIERAGLSAIVLYHLTTFLAEHFYFHGVILAVCRSQAGWPAPPPVAAVADRSDAASCARTSLVGRALRWIGLAQPRHGAGGIQGLTRWLGLPGGCVLPIVVSGSLFAVCHAGKNPRELLLSLPGGLALAYLAYRTNTWLIPYALHLCVAGLASLLIVWLRPALG